MSALAETNWLLAATGSRVHDFYDAIGVELPKHQGMEAMVHCFANAMLHRNDDRNKSCSVNLLTGLWKCHGCGEHGNPWKAAIVVGYDEKRARELAQSHGLFLEVEKPKLPNERELKRFRDRLQGSPRILERLGVLKGWTPEAIVRLGLGWDGERVTFPIRNHKLKIVGMVRYVPGGKPKSLAVAGSKRLLFPAPETLGRSRPVFLVEGEPDAVSVRSCGCQAVGVPGAGGWRPEFAKRLAPFRVVILPDCDSQGRELAYRAKSMMPKATVVDLEPTVADGMDIGDWVLGASREGGLRQLRRVLERL